MKKLYIVRHAKSCWDNHELEDIDRPLNNIGITDSSLIWEYLKKQDVSLDIIVSSPAMRCLMTAQIIAPYLKYPVKYIQLDKKYYNLNDDWDKILNYIEKTSDDYEKLLVIGHNNTFENLVSKLTNGVVSKFPTCWVISLTFDINKWEDCSKTIPSIDFFISPKDLKV